MKNSNTPITLSISFVVYSSHSINNQIDQSITHRGVVLSDWPYRLRFFICWRVNMVTVIADQEELTTPVHNGGNTDPNDHERTFSYIKDYQEVRDDRLSRTSLNKFISFQVDFHRSPSCKPLPENLFGTAEDPQMKSSVSHSNLVSESRRMREETEDRRMSDRFHCRESERERESFEAITVLMRRNVSKVNRFSIPRPTNGEKSGRTPMPWQSIRLWKRLFMFRGYREGSAGK